MATDTTFKPLAPTTLVGVTAIQASAQPGQLQQAGVTSFRIRNILATAQVLGWGVTAAAAVATPATAAAPQNAITLGGAANVPAVYLELPYNTWFIANIAAAFEVTPGTGGVGG